MEISFTKPNQIMNMGGPWIGTLIIDSKIIAENVLIDNWIIAKDDKHIYIVKHYIQRGVFKSKNIFRINKYDLISNELIEINEDFDAIFLKTIDKNQDILYYKAFYDIDDNDRIHRLVVSNPSSADKK